MSPATVHSWVEHAKDQRLDRVDWHDRPRAPRNPPRTAAAIEEQVLAVWRELEQDSDLGFHGAAVIHQVLSARTVEGLPTVRTIGRILLRRGVLGGQVHVRRPAPPTGWYLPEVAAHRLELDCFDVVEGLVIKGGRRSRSSPGSLCTEGSSARGPKRRASPPRSSSRGWSSTGRKSACPATPSSTTT